jgi:RNA polymerase sigma-70 factor, ECF subfamily
MASPAIAVYERTETDTLWIAHSIYILILDDDRISALTTFIPPTGPKLIRAFGFPLPV